MKPAKPGEDRLSHVVFGLTLYGLTMTKLILWLIAITIASFAIGIAILALSGGFTPGPDPVATPFNNTAFQSPNTTSFPLDGAASGTIRITLGTGDLNLQGGAGDGRLMDATVFSRSAEMQPDYVQSMNNSEITVSMTESGHKKKDWVATHTPDSWANTWDVQLCDAVPLALTVNVGAGDNTLSLGSTNLSSLTVNTGAGDTLIDLSGYSGGQYAGTVHNGVGDLTIRIDKTSNTRILLHQGIGDIDTRGIVQTRDTYVPAGFNPALPVNEIVITQGIGSIQLEAV